MVVESALLGSAVDWLVDHDASAFGQAAGVGGIRKILEENDELVAADASDGVAFAEHGFEPEGRGLQHSVACAVAVGVVYVFEPVNVAEQHAGD